MIPSGFAETGNQELQDEIVEIANRYKVRMLGPNIYGYYYTPQNLCATFCTPYDVKGGVALTSQSGGIGMAILGFARTTKTGVSAIVGLGNKSDLDEDDLIEFYGQDPNTRVIAMHVEDIKDGRAFVDAAKRVSKEKPIVVLKAGRTAAGARAAASHTGALAGTDAVYEAAFREAGVVRARTLEDLLDWSRALAMLPEPRGEDDLPRFLELDPAEEGPRSVTTTSRVARRLAARAGVTGADPGPQPLPATGQHYAVRPAHAEAAARSLGAEPPGRAAGTARAGTAEPLPVEPATARMAQKSRLSPLAWVLAALALAALLAALFWNRR